MAAQAQRRPFKDIVVFVNFSMNGESEIRFAAGMATNHRARLLGIHVVGDPPRCNANVRGSGAIQSTIENFVVRKQRLATETGNRFLDIASQYNAKAAYRVVWSDSDMSRRIVLNALLADVIVIGKDAPHGLPENWHPEKLLSLCGAPLLMVPSEAKAEAVPQRITVAWNSSKQARRAIADAMPFLLRAKSVDILAVDHDDDQSSIDLALHLGRHGVRAKVKQIEARDLSIGAAIVSETDKSKTDLIVMGAFGHTKAVRMMFGGVTQTIVNLAKVPVLMSR